MDFDKFDFALFIKDETAPEGELRVRKELYHNEKCDLYILMRRKPKGATVTDWKLSVQTIHAMIFLVADSAHEDNTVKTFTKPSIYKDLLLSAVFSDSIHSSSRKRMPLWLWNSLSGGFFDCYYKCSLRIELPEDSADFSSLGGQQTQYLLQAIIKPCPNHFSSYQLTSQMNNLPSFPEQACIDSPLTKRVVSLALLHDNSTSSTHVSLSLPVSLENSLKLSVAGQNGDIQLLFENQCDHPICLDTFTSYITDVVFVDEFRRSKTQTDYAIVNSYELPKHSPTILSDIHLSTNYIPNSITLVPNQRHSIQAHVEYTQNHASSFATLDRSERSECDVYIRIHIQWTQPMSLYPLTRYYDLRVRLHPKPQMAIQYQCESVFRLMQANKVKIEVTNLSMHTYRDFKVLMDSRSEMMCNIVEQVITESLPHSVTVFSIIVVPQYPGEWTLPFVSCVDANEKCIPSDCKSVMVQVMPSFIC